MRLVYGSLVLLHSVTLVTSMGCDIQMLFDMSETTHDNFKTEINFGVNLVQNFASAYDAGLTRFTYLTFSTQVYESTTFGTITTAAALEKALNNTAENFYKDGITNTNAALSVAETIQRLSTRPVNQAYRFVILFSNADHNETTQDPQMQARVLRSEMATIFAIRLPGVNNETDLAELNSISGSGSNVFESENYKDLDGIMNQLMQILALTCPIQDESLPSEETVEISEQNSNTYFQCDIQFIFDMTDGIDYNNELLFAQYFVEQFNNSIATQDVRFSWVPFSNMIFNVTNFGRYQSVSGLTHGLGQLPYYPGTPSYAYNAFLQSNGVFQTTGRSNVFNVALYISNGRYDNSTMDPCNSAVYLRNTAKVTIFSIPMNDSTKQNLTELACIGGSSQNVVPMDFNNFVRSAEQMAAALPCGK